MTGKLNIPTHIGIIMDGNGRWAEARGLPRIEGHRQGAERAREVISTAKEAGVEVLTLYTFSSENWQRPENEVSLLMKLLERYLKKEFDDLKRGNIRFRVIGETWRLPAGIQSLIRKTEEATVDNSSMTLVAALSYGGRDEIVRAARKALALGMKPEELTDGRFDTLVDTVGLPPADLIIRTSGELRLSNFLTWQSAYAELYFTDTLWPDFTKDEFMKAIEDYQHRDRRFGAVPVRKD